mgnify:FL=1|tara:strand:+ start:1910 stop:2254 length:345 start_codon:yes stop_codon:yes gene_type:complete
MFEGGMMAHIGLCEGRHEIKQNNGEALDGFIFSTVENPMDFDRHESHAQDWLLDHYGYEEPAEGTTIHLYVTGLTVLLTCFLNVMRSAFPMVSVVLMHYDRDSQQYVEQPMFSQ